MGVRDGTGAGVLLVLSVLKRGDGHGFEILKRLEVAGEGALKLEEGMLYPALNLSLPNIASMKQPAARDARWCDWRVADAIEASETGSANGNTGERSAQDVPRSAA